MLRWPQAELAMAMAVMGMMGALLCAVSPAWGARGHHWVAFGHLVAGAALALAAAVMGLR